MSPIIAISGNIGAGKTTLALGLSKAIGAELFRESVEDNPYLADFYGDMHRWSCLLQFHFLGHRALQYRKALECSKMVVLDRTIYEDAEIFAPMLADAGFIERRDYATYLQIYEAISTQTPPPLMLIHLTSSVETLVDRIRLRGRSYEQNISSTYLAELKLRYDEWARNFLTCPILNVDVDTVDIRAESTIAEILDSIRNLIDASSYPKTRAS